MTGMPVDRRRALTLLASAPLAGFAAPSIARASPRIVVVGGGFAGASAARTAAAAGAEVTLVEPNETYCACPFSNEVIVGLRAMERQRFGYDGLVRRGVTVARLAATALDPDRRRLTLDGGETLDYDRLIAAPGVDMNFEALPGYDAAAAERMPHAWKAGPQTLLLARMLDAMEDGGVVVMSVPANPYRCPPGPYERASLIAGFLKARKPRSKVIVLDAKEKFSKQALFLEAWKALYPGQIEHVPLSGGGRVISVDPGASSFMTEFDTVKAAVGNVIPPQRAGSFARAIGVADRTGWCPIDPLTFESRLVPNVHVIGDACAAGAMPKSAFSADQQARVCAAAAVALASGEPPAAAKLANTCYSIVAPGYGFSIAGVYRPTEKEIVEVEGSGGVSPLGASLQTRAAEAAYAEAWFGAITENVFG